MARATSQPAAFALLLFVLVVASTSAATLTKTFTRRADRVLGDRGVLSLQLSFTLLPNPNVTVHEALYYKLASISSTGIVFLNETSEIGFNSTNNGVSYTDGEFAVYTSYNMSNPGYSNVSLALKYQNGLSSFFISGSEFLSGGSFSVSYSEDLVVEIIRSPNIEIPPGACSSYPQLIVYLVNVYPAMPGTDASPVAI